MPNVYELQGSMNNMVVHNNLVFPNVQTCCAFIGVTPGGLVGAHVTLGDRERLGAVVQRMANDAGAALTELYIVARNYEYNWNVPAGRVPTHLYVHPGGFVDVSADYAGGIVHVGSRTAGSHAAFVPIPLASFT